MNPIRAPTGRKRFRKVSGVRFQGLGPDTWHLLCRLLTRAARIAFLLTPALLIAFSLGIALPFRFV
ncbi:MAG: hypothetical protein A3J28_17395 [Acidobacteria bacterium RIFCSPLOWO2_12_FULL_60_22]|nr:MAG: hypothetical protein A3J28_17395 [Acidobacteria bacterium RIFCSPLOWO2_12_FULL_60_22]